MCRGATALMVTEKQDQGKDWFPAQQEHVYHLQFAAWTPQWAASRPQEILHHI